MQKSKHVKSGPELGVRPKSGSASLRFILTKTVYTTLNRTSHMCSKCSYGINVNLTYK